MEPGHRPVSCAHRIPLTRLAGKTACKLALQKELGLPEDRDVPLFGTISRLAEQKGVDIQLGALEEMLSTNMQFVLLGSGSSGLRTGLSRTGAAFSRPRSPCGWIMTKAWRIALKPRCDFYLMPSRFEPSGLNQMYSLRYGTIPIVRATGGLDDSVIDFTEDATRANGIKFHEYSARALAKAIRKALALYQQPDLLRQYRRNAMKTVFSWERTVGEYLKAYELARNFRMRSLPS